MVYVNQLHLMKYGVKKNKHFLQQMYDFEGMAKSFSMLDSSVSWKRSEDTDMTLDKFLELIDSKSDFLLQLASPEPFEIRYAACLYTGAIRRTLFIDGPYTPENFDLVSKLYSESFGVRLEDEPVRDGLVEYYLERTRAGY